MTKGNPPACPLPAGPENRAAEARTKGRFPKGRSPNPGGRPKAVVDLVTRARALTPAALDVLEAALASDDDRVRLAAAGMLLDRGWGRPPQAVALAVAETTLGPKRGEPLPDPARATSIVALLEGLGLVPPSPPVPMPEADPS